MSIIPAKQEAEIRRLKFKASPDKKVRETSSLPLSQAWWHIPVIPPTQEMEIGGQGASPRQKSQDPL
jgi:hypothetical protein